MSIKRKDCGNHGNRFMENREDINEMKTDIALIKQSTDRIEMMLRK